MQDYIKLKYLNLNYISTPSLNSYSRFKLTIPISSLKLMKCSILIAFDITSANCFWVLQYTPFQTWLCRKWNFVQMCLLLPWNIGFLTRLMEDLLSIINMTVILTLNFNSCRKFISRTIWHTDKATTMYLTSKVDSATTGFFLKDQEMGTPSYINRYPVVLHMSTLSPHQFKFT